MALSVFGRRSDDPFDSLFDSAMSSFPSSIFSSGYNDYPGFARDVAAVANTQVDWKETEDSHIFKANLPGLGKEDVKVQIDDGRVLQISGERKKEETAATDRWHRVERSQGSFLRRFRLPENTRVENVSAAMENGVLTVTVPKIPPENKSAAKRIEISG